MTSLLGHNWRKAYSYVRFSTPDQSKGDSLRRQLAASAAYAEKHGLELDDTLRDLGVSASRGANRTKGALGAFLKKVESGEIPRGSVLIVEALDRLTREQLLDALQLFLSIILAGIKVVSLMDGMEYDEASINANPMQLGYSLMILSQGNQYTAALGKRVAEAKARERALAATGKITRHRPPAWLEWRDDALEGKGGYVVKEGAAETIKQIFKWKASGIGTEAIVRLLNSDPKVWHHGRWRKAYVDKILHSRAVIGEWHPGKMIDGKSQPTDNANPNFYPVMVDPDLFHRVQAIFKRYASIPGRGGGVNSRSISNLFGHIARCRRCGGTMRYFKSGRHLPKHGEHLQCDSAYRGLGCNKRLIRYDRLAPMLLHLCRGLDPQDLLTDEAEKAREQARLSQRRQAIEGELGEIKRQVDNLADQIANTDNAAVRQLLDTKLNAKLSRQAELEQELQMSGSEIRSNTAEAVVQHLQSIEELIQRMAQLQGDERSALRRRLRHALQQLVDRIDLERGRLDTKVTISFKDSGILYLVLDARGNLREAQDGAMLYTFDAAGNVVDVASDHGEDTAERTRRVNRIVAEALKRRSHNPLMTVE